MPRLRRKALVRESPLTPVPSEILDQFVRQGPISLEELDAAVRRFKKALIERALGSELTDADPSRDLHDQRLPTRGIVNRLYTQKTRHSPWRWIPGASFAPFVSVNPVPSL